MNIKKPQLQEKAYKESKRQIEQILLTKKARYQQEYIRCGKKSCNKCPHGPYWYAYFIVNGREICKYIGKELDFIPGDSGQYRKRYDARERISEEQKKIIDQVFSEILK